MYIHQETSMNRRFHNAIADDQATREQVEQTASIIRLSRVDRGFLERIKTL